MRSRSPPTSAPSPPPSAALAQRALIAIDRHDWMQAEAFATRPWDRPGGQLDDYEMSPLIHAVAARTALHQGDVPAPETTSRGPPTCDRG